MELGRALSPTYGGASVNSLLIPFALVVEIVAQARNEMWILLDPMMPVSTSVRLPLPDWVRRLHGREPSAGCFWVVINKKEELYSVCVFCCVHHTGTRTHRHLQFCFLFFLSFLLLRQHCSLRFSIRLLGVLIIIVLIILLLLNSWLAPSLYTYRYCSLLRFFLHLSSRALPRNPPPHAIVYLNKQLSFRT